MTVTGTGGSLTRTTPIGLTVNARHADFTLSATPASLTVARGTSGTSTVDITRTGGFTGSVAFTASGLPTGVTAAFSPDVDDGRTPATLTLTASATATLGAGDRDGHRHRRRPHPHHDHRLTVTAAPTPDFSLSATPGHRCRSRRAHRDQHDRASPA